MTDGGAIDLPRPDWLEYENENSREALKHILAGKVLKSPEKFLPRSLFIAFWARFAFNDACPVSFRQAAAKHLMDMLGYSQAQAIPEAVELDGDLDLEEKEILGEAKE